ncbi:hypothetical protein GCM10017600_68390 [Streptosporangium carneum]|uniref:Uncharacterized protein n=1 Tax=Streptosporangium carneum TaxID=47481 RepID=A0A9W6I891_9ACTN|nr:hypothetical protein GCM10017600_68390 [Streptosporangium carneum]
MIHRAAFTSGGMGCLSGGAADGSASRGTFGSDTKPPVRRVAGRDRVNPHLSVVEIRLAGRVSQG